MPTFNVAFDSSPPSTPDTRSRRQGYGPDYSLTSNPSTTPAGPPNAAPVSFTPVGPPPSTPFGSSVLVARDTAPKSQPLFSFTSSAFQAPAPTTKVVTNPSQGGPLFGDRTQHGTPPRPFWFASTNPTEAAGEENKSDADAENEDEPGEDDRMDEDQASRDDAESVEEDESRMDEDQSSRSADGDHPVMTSSYSFTAQRLLASMGEPTPPQGSSQRLRPGQEMDTTRKDSPAALQARLPFSKIVRQRTATSGSATLHEPDDMILGTEELLSRLAWKETSAQGDRPGSSDSLPQRSEELLRWWQPFSEASRMRSDAAKIGPDEQDSPISKAMFLVSLLLPLHHPPALTASNLHLPSRTNRSQALRRSFGAQTSRRSMPFPRILLGWLDAQHNPTPDGLNQIRAHRPDPSHHPYFWDATLSAVLRGKMDEAIEVLQTANFGRLAAPSDSISSHSGSAEERRQNIQDAIGSAIQVLEQCPAVTHADWSLTGSNWAVFRLRASQASRNLKTFVEEALPMEGELDASSFSAEHFGIRSQKSRASTFATASRMARSKIPLDMYEHLQSLYGILSGNAADIVALAQDWVEATVGLTVWWDGQSETPPLQPSLSRSGRSDVSKAGDVDADLGARYLDRLSQSFHQVTDPGREDAFRVNTMNPVEVGLAAVLIGDVEGLVAPLRSWSLVMASTVVRLGRRGGWLDPSSPDPMMTEFDQSDLMVLSYDQPGRRSWKDDVLVDYAHALLDRESLQGKIPSHDPAANRGSTVPVVRHGWELCIQVLARLSNTETAHQKIQGLLEQLPLESEDQVDHLIAVCRDLGLGGQALQVAERYADALADGSDNYGATLIYYARAHQRTKLKSVVNLLVSYCLVQSTAYPPESELDDRLRSLIASPPETLRSIAERDRDAAAMLQHQLSGYASLRAFYQLRDEAVNAPAGQPPRTRELVRKKRALGVLLALIRSASDSIHGGLYDEGRGSVISVDSLLVLLGEAMVFVDAPKRLLKLTQVFELLKAVEDLQTVAPRIYRVCEDMFKTSQSAARGSPVSSPTVTLKKSLSSLTASTNFSMIGSSMLESRANGTTEDSSVLVMGEIPRGWDWRTRLRANVTGKDVLQMLRLRLANELARAWLAGDEGA